MCHRQNDGVVTSGVQCVDQAKPVLVLDLLRVGPRIVGIDLQAVLEEFVADVHDFGVSDVGAILLESDAQKKGATFLDGFAFSDEEFHHFARDKEPHGVVDAAPTENDGGMVA